MNPSDTAQLTDLPPEIWAKIWPYLGPIDLFNFALTNKEWYEYIHAQCYNSKRFMSKRQSLFKTQRRQLLRSAFFNIWQGFILKADEAVRNPELNINQFATFSHPFDQSTLPPMSIITPALEGLRLGLIKRLTSRKDFDPNVTAEQGKFRQTSYLHIAVTNPLCLQLGEKSRARLRQIIKCLIEAGSDTGKSDLGGNTPLVAAIKCRYHVCVEGLLSNGADPNAHGTNNHVPLITAAALNDIHSTSELLYHGARIHETNMHGDTALLIATRLGHTQVCRMLLCADLTTATATNRCGVNALEIARTLPDQVIAQLLTAAYALLDRAPIVTNDMITCARIAHDHPIPKDSTRREEYANRHGIGESLFYPSTSP